MKIATLYSDYDVINYGFTSDILNSTKENSYFCRERAVVYLGKEGVMDIEQAILQFNNQPFREGPKRGSCSDMNIIVKYTKCFSLKLDEHNREYCSNIGPDFLNDTPLVHYDGGCYRRGIDKKLSRLQVIREHNRL